MSFVTAQGWRDNSKVYHHVYDASTFPSDICKKGLAYSTSRGVNQCVQLGTNSSERITCEVMRGFTHLKWGTNYECRFGWTEETWTATRQCYWDGTHGRVEICGTDFWSTITDLPYIAFFQGAGNITYSSSSCIEGENCFGPRQLDFKTSDCSGSPQAYPIFEGPVKTDICYAAPNYANVLLQCEDGLSSQFFYNNGCGGSPFKSIKRVTDLCIKKDDGTSYMYRC